MDTSTDTTSKSPTKPSGGRKSKVSWQSQVALLIGFGLACWMKAPVELYVAYVVGIGGTAFSFMWGNTNEHKANNGKTPPAP